MKKSVTVFLCALFVSVAGYAQPYVPEYYKPDTTRPMMIRLAYQLNYQTSSMPNYFASYFLNGGRISNDDKNQVSSNLKNVNRAGAEQGFSIRFYDYSTHPFKDSTLGYYLNVEHQDHIGVSFSKNLFDLVFYGNGPYAGQTLNVAPLNGVRYTYQKIGFGISDVETGSSFGVSLVKGQAFTMLNFTKGDFYTDDSTANIKFDYAAELARSDTGKTNWSAFNGTGMAVDFNWNFSLWRDSILPDLARWQFRVQNAGFITWNNSSLGYAADSSVSYNGFEVSNILQPEEGLLTGNTDIKDTLNIKYTQKKYFSLMPADFVLGNYVNPYAGYWLKPLLGVRYKLIEGYKLMAYAGASLRLSRNAYIQLTGSYGGFGGFRVGARIQGNLGKNFAFLLGTAHADGLYSSNGFGKDGYIALSVKF